MKIPRLFKVNPSVQMNAQPEMMNGINPFDEDLLIERIFQSNRARAFSEQISLIESKQSEKLTARDRSKPGFLLEMKSTRTRIRLNRLKPRQVCVSSYWYFAS